MKLPYFGASFLWVICAVMWFAQGFRWTAVGMVAVAIACLIAGRHVDSWRYR